MSSTDLPTWEFYSTMAVLCMSSYARNQSSVNLAKRLLHVDVENSTQIQQGHSIVQVYSTQEQNVIVVVRGTIRHHLPHWIVDLNFIPQRHSRTGLVHSGFYSEMLKVWPEVDYAVRSRLKPHSKIFITGHSMGGAVAMLLAEMLSYNGHRITDLITFGQPKTGSRKFCDHINSLADFRYHRVVNNVDLVPMLPPGWMGYVHCGTEIYINRTSKISTSSTVQKIQDGIAGICAALKNNRMPAWWCDHDIRHYVYHIKKIVRKTNRS